MRELNIDECLALVKATIFEIEQIQGEPSEENKDYEYIYIAMLLQNNLLKLLKSAKEKLNETSTH